MSGVRVGLGWDRHRLVPGRRLVLGGVEVPHDRGLEGHSDGDVLLHAVADAVLGAAGLGDLGGRFPPSDPKWKDADSRDLLREVVAAARARGLVPVQADTIVVIESPRLAEHRAAIVLSLADLLGLPPESVNLKAKTAEGLGPAGTGEAADAHAVVVMEPLP